MYISRQRGQVRVIPPRVRRPFQRGQMGDLGIFPLIIPFAISAAQPLLSKLMSGGKGHQCSKQATDPESFLACWPYHPIPDNYVPWMDPSKNAWDWTFYYGARNGRPDPGQDPNIAVSQQQCLGWEGVKIPVTFDSNGICRRTDGGGQTSTPVDASLFTAASPAVSATAPSGFSQQVMLSLVASAPLCV